MAEEGVKTGSGASAGKRRLATGWVSAAFSAAAVLFSAYSLWESRLKQSDLRVFVPAVIEYSAPYQNSNFEAIKRFYAANFGRWTMERTRSGAYQPFAPIALAGYSSRTEAVQFYTRGEDEQPPNVIRETQVYRFTMTLRDVANDRRAPLTLSFERELRHFDARVFNTGTLWLYPTDWHAAKQAASNVSAP
jgi:hypothetical protein